MSDPTAHPALAAGVLRCPHHGRAAGGSAPTEQALHLDDDSLMCAAGHRFVRAVAAMGPSAHHLDAVELDRRVAALPDPFEVVQAVVVSTYRRAGP